MTVCNLPHERRVALHRSAVHEAGYVVVAHALGFESTRLSSSSVPALVACLLMGGTLVACPLTRCRADLSPPCANALPGVERNLDVWLTLIPPHS